MSMLKPFRRTSRALGAALALFAAACGDQIAAPTAQPGPVRLLIVSGDLQTAPPGTELPQPIVVKVVDENGDPVPNQIVNFRVVEGSGSVFAGAALTSAQGIAQEHWTLGPGSAVAAAPQRIEVRAVDSETGQKQVFARFTAFALLPPTVGKVRTAGDSVVVEMRMTYGAGTYTYVWDVGDNTGTFRKFGETVGLSPTVEVTLPNDRAYWFCYYARNAEGLRSAWQCSYTGGPF